MITEQFHAKIQKKGRDLFDRPPSESPISPERLDGTITTLYVHVPFCLDLCPFCPFLRVPFKQPLADRYFADLQKERDGYAQLGLQVSSVYVGGGTPTTIIEKLGPFIEDLHKQNPGLKDVSIETHPHNLTEKNLALLKAIGITRLSIGVQSIDAELLTAMGRSNGPIELVREQILMARELFSTVNVDFMMNLEHETIEQLLKKIKFFKSLNSQGTFYPLMPAKKRFNTVDTSREKQFYTVLLRNLLDDGYAASSPWCFSRGESMTDEYITDDADYVGIGPSAISYIGGKFHINTFSLDRYHEQVEAGGFPIISQRELSPMDATHQYLLTKLFGMTVSMEDIRHRLGYNVLAESELMMMKAAGWISGTDVLQVTEQGMYPLSVMMKDFLIGLNSFRAHCIDNKI